MSLSLLGIISLNLAFERVMLMKRVEKLEALETEELLGTLPKEAQIPIRQAVRDYVELHRSKEALRVSNEHFFGLADEILDNQRILLKSISQHKFDVPSELTSIAQRKLLSRFRLSLDAVSEDDLSFWLDPRSRDYFEAGAAAIKRGTKINRIFIITVAELINRRNDLVEVLKRQHQAGIGWAIAIAEEFDPDVTELDLPRDFALLDKDKVVTFFKKRGSRFEAIFNTPDNQKILDTQRTLYRNLISECWVANSRFKGQYKDGWAPQDINAIQNKTQISNSRLKADINLDIDDNAAPFVYLVDDVSRIEETMQNLARIVSDWRKFRGFDLPRGSQH